MPIFMKPWFGDRSLPADEEKKLMVRTLELNGVSYFEFPTFRVLTPLISELAAALNFFSDSN